MKKQKRKRKNMWGVGKKNKKKACGGKLHYFLYAFGNMNQLVF
jgi:hypothetical protein